jgi:hypothetical protein
MHPRGIPADAFFLFSLNVFPFAKQQGDTPKTGKTDQGKNDSADHGALSAEQPRNQVKLENTDQTPVQTSDDGKNQRNGIHDIPPFFLDAIVFPLGEKL